MLRITENKKIRFHVKDRLFSRDFRKALFYALSFHIAFLVLFRIAIFPDLNNTPLLKPIKLEVDLGPSYSQVLLPLSLTQSFVDKVEPLLFIDLPSLDLDEGRELFSQLKCSEPDFSEIENFEYKSALLEDEEI